jgi:CheY-like chemotaxis protein
VVRNKILPDFRHAIALQFAKKLGDGDGLEQPTPFANQVRVLGVGADNTATRAICDLLKGDGYHVVYVATASQALDILREETPDVMIVEAEGKEISGADLCAIVKKNERLQHIPVILLTRSALPSDYAAGYQLGAIMCMMNPCEPGRLQNAVRLAPPPPAARSVYSGNFNLSAYTRTS